MDYEEFDKVHHEVLSAIGKDYTEGYELYLKNLHLYDAHIEKLGEHKNKFKCKLDVCGAMSKATGTIGTSSNFADTTLAGKALDEVIFNMVDSKKIRLKKGELVKI